MRASTVLFISALACLLLASAVTAATLRKPTEITYDSNGVTNATLTVRWTTVTMDGAGTFSTRAYFVDGVAQFPGPLLRLKPGGKLNLTLINELGSNSAADASRAHNTYKNVNTTNIHTHGLHVDPAIDSIFRKADPSSTLHYDMPIPSAHYPGTHWYHAHHHGASNLQLMGGLFGMMIVDSPAGVTVPTAISSLTEEIFVIHPMKFASTAATSQDCSNRQTPTFDPFRVWSFSDLESEIGSAVTASQSLSISDTDFLLVNGMYQPEIAFAPGQSKVFRMLYAAGFGHPKMTITGSSCSMTVIAVDGVYIDTPRNETTLVFVPATRYDVVITCNSTGTYHIRNADGGSFNGVFAKIVVSGTSTSSAVVPASLTSITKPYYLQDMSSTAGTSFHELSFAQAGSPDCMWVFGQGSGCTQRPPTNCPSAVFSGEKGTTAADVSKYSHAPKLGEVEEWTIHAGGNEPHPLHIHVNHFQVVEFTPAGTTTLDDYGLKLGEWHDTIPALDGDTKIRFKTYTFTGEIVMHCHVLSHEDRGLMSTWLIQPNETASSSTPAPPTPPGTPSPTSGSGSGTPSPTAGSGSLQTDAPAGTPSPANAGSTATTSGATAPYATVLALLALLLNLLML